MELEGITLSFGGLQVLDGISLEVHKGEILGLVGPNGAGKTTLLNCISGVYRPDQGSMSLQSRSLTGLRPHRIARLGVGRTFQTPLPITRISVLEFVMIGRHCHFASGALSYALAIPWLSGREKDQRHKALRALDYVGLAGMEDRPLTDLPYGSAKLADLARVLASEPQLVLLDEPAAGLDARTQLVEILRRLPADLGVTVLLIEHDMSVVQQVCQRLVVMSQGSILRVGPPAAVLSDPEVVTVFLGEELTVRPRLQEDPS